MRIRAKYASTCRKCRGPVDVGQEVDWTPGEGVEHADSDHCAMHSAQQLGVRDDCEPDPMNQGEW